MPVEQAGVPAPNHSYAVGTSAAQINIGDLVVMGTDNRVQVAASGGASISGTGSVNVCGVAAETILASPASGTSILVYDDPNQVFIVQDNGNATGGMGATGVGAGGYQFAVDATTTTTLSTRAVQPIRSAMVLFASSGSAARVAVGSTTGGNLPVLVLQLHPIEGTASPTTSGQYRKWLVKMNAHLFQNSAAG